MATIPDLLAAGEFERLFVEELGWDRFSRREEISLVAPGQESHGFRTRDERARVSLLRRWTFDVAAVAQKRGQTVFHATWRDSSALPIWATRFAVARRVGHLYATPLIVFTAPETGRHHWVWESGRETDVDPFTHTFDPKDPYGGAAERLPALAFDMSEEDDLTLLDVQRRMADALTARRTRRGRGRREIDHDALAPFGEYIAGLAVVADAHRGVGRDEERVLFAMARDGNRDAETRLFLANLYIPLNLSLRRWEKEPSTQLEFADLVQAAALGLVRALGNYDPAKTSRFMTLASFWCVRNLDRLYAEEGTSIAMPVYVQDRLGTPFKERDVFEDRLIQLLERVPGPSEVDRAQGLAPSDRRAAAVARLRAVPLEEHDGPHDGGRFCTMGVPTAPDEWIERRSELVSLLDPMLEDPRGRAVMMLRYGLHPARPGDPATLDELAQIFGITRERARQIEIRALKALRKAHGVAEQDQKGA